MTGTARPAIDDSFWVSWTVNGRDQEGQVRVRITADDGAISAELYEWLRDDRTAGVAAVSTDSETLGALDVIDVVLTQVTAWANLAVAIAAWRQSRSPAPAVTLTRPDGATLTLVAGEAGSAALIQEFLTGASPAGDESETPSGAEGDTPAADVR
jgi:hypothetical protein